MTNTIIKITLVMLAAMTLAAIVNVVIDVAYILNIKDIEDIKAIKDVLSIDVMRIKWKEFLQGLSTVERGTNIIIGILWFAGIATGSVAISFLVHEIGHWIIYRVAGTRAIIRKVSLFKMITLPVDKEGNVDEGDVFNNKLKVENPRLYFILCISGVGFATIIGCMLTIILVYSQVIFSWPIVWFIVIYNAFVVFDYEGNIWTKRDKSDGYKVKKMFRDME